MRRYHITIQRHGEPPFPMYTGELEPGEVTSMLMLGALRMLDAEDGWRIEIQPLPDPQGDPWTS